MSTAVFTRVLMFFAGLAWLTFLWPPFAKVLEPFNMLFGLIGESPLTLWLLVMGVKHSQERNT